MAANDRPGAVIAARLSILAAECADPDRFSRGRRYAREGAVVALEVSAGEVIGHVQGSERAPYVVHVRWHPSQFRPGLVPTRDELRLSCTCADSAPVCKHAVAVLVHLADRVGVTPSVLYDWRGPDEAWEHLPVRPALQAVPDQSGAERGRASRAPGPSRSPEPDYLAPFFGIPGTLGAAWDADDLDPFPEVTPLAAPLRPLVTDPVAVAAAGFLDEAMDALAALFG